MECTVRKPTYIGNRSYQVGESVSLHEIVAAALVRTGHVVHGEEGSSDVFVPPSPEPPVVEGKRGRGRPLVPDHLLKRPRRKRYARRDLHAEPVSDIAED